MWWARITRRGVAPVEHSLVAVRSARFPAGAAVDLSALNARGRRPTGWLVDLRYRTVDGVVVRIDVAPGLCALPLSFTELHHADSLLPAVTLAAHLGRSVAGRLRWQPRSGLVETLAVPLAGRGVEQVLPVVADALATFRGWPALHGDIRISEPVVRRGVERLVGDLPARLI